jgi:hypothetical protein
MGRSNSRKPKPRPFAEAGTVPGSAFLTVLAARRYAMNNTSWTLIAVFYWQKPTPPELAARAVSVFG